VKNTFFYIALIMLNSCSFAQKENLVELDIEFNNSFHSESEIGKLELDSVLCGLNFVKGTNYPKTKNEIAQLKVKLGKEYTLLIDSIEKRKFIDSVGDLFTEKLVNEIIPYWYGTKWDFNGYTAIPNQGVIACGYFVSTTLKDMGLNLNRYKLAQQGPENEAKTVSISDENLFSFEIIHFSTISEMLRELKEGLYFVGVDSHVGYFYKKGEYNLFLHSNYIEGKVMVEIAEISMAFKSTRYYFSSISANQELILSWLTNKQVEIIK